MNKISKVGIAELFDLTGMGAIVTGAAQGIGQAIAFRLAEAGAGVLLAGHNAAALEKSAATIGASGGKAAWIEADASDIDDADRIAHAAIEAFGSLDILVNNAGGMHPFTPTLEVTEDTWRKTLDRNFKGGFFLSQRAARHMVNAGRGGRIVNIASTAGLRSDPQLAAYNAAKAAVISLTKSLAYEFAQYGILVNTIAPGATMTPNTAPVYEVPAVQKIVAERIPLGHVGEPEDIANAVLFLSGKASKNITGSLLVIDGGLLLS